LVFFFIKQKAITRIKTAPTSEHVMIIRVGEDCFVSSSGTGIEEATFEWMGEPVPDVSYSIERIEKPPRVFIPSDEPLYFS
jgi:hypothetical protein